MKSNLYRLLKCAGIALLAVSLVTLVLDMAQGATSSLTRITTGVGADAPSNMYPSMSADGTKIAFQTFQSDDNSDSQISLYDTTTFTLTRITPPSSGRWNEGASISADGRKVAFDSNADFFSQGILPTQYEIWLYDTAAMTLTRITTASPGNRDSYFPRLNSQGSKLAFTSDSDFLGQGIPPDQFEVWLYDTVTMTVTRITTATGSGDRNSGLDTFMGYGLDISADGTKIVFTSDSDLLHQGIPDDQHEIWLYNTATMTFTRVTTANAPDRSSYRPRLTHDAAKIAFVSNADFLGEGLPANYYEIWVYDTASLTLTRVTTTVSGSDSIGSYDPSWDANGTKIAFASDYAFLRSEIWLYDFATMTYTRITSATGSGNRSSFFPSLSADGRLIAFNSDADFLNQGIPSGQTEIWLYRSLDKEFYLPVVLKKSNSPDNC